MKKLIVLALVMFSGLAFLVVWFYSNTKPVSGNTDLSSFIITKGSSASRVAENLQKDGLIKNAFAFKFYVQITGSANKIQAGEYKLSPGFSLFEVVDQLLKGPVEIWVTIPEGLRLEEVALRFAGALDRDTTFVDGFLASSKGKEGTLFPDTYLFPKDASPAAVVNRMTKTFEAKTVNLTLDSELSFDQAIILASLLERETLTNAERPIVAGILIKRIQSGWPLQVDAAVQYAVGSSKCPTPGVKCDRWWEPLTKTDLDSSSPYNTYKFAGFPPGPIASPGISSIEAAFNPIPSDYWYYIHDNSGQIHYARTLEEHNSNINKYLRK